MRGITYRFKGQVARMNKHGQETSSWNSPQEFTVYAASAGEACVKVSESIGDPGAEYTWGFRFSSMEEVVYP